MGDYSIKALRADVRMHMRLLERDGFGTMAGTNRRDTFVLDPELPGASRLTGRVGSQRNVVRAEDGSLLFRDASAEFHQALPPDVQRRAEADQVEGLTFLWTKIGKADLRALFSTVRSLASTRVGEPGRVADRDCLPNREA